MAPDHRQQKNLIGSISNNIFSSLQKGGAGEPWRATFTEKFGMFEIPRWTWTISSRMRSQEVKIQTLECFLVTYLPLNPRWLSFKTNWVKMNCHVLVDVVNIVCKIFLTLFGTIDFWAPWQQLHSQPPEYGHRQAFIYIWSNGKKWEIWIRWLCCDGAPDWIWEAQWTWRPARHGIGEILLLEKSLYCADEVLQVEAYIPVFINCVLSY